MFLSTIIRISIRGHFWIILQSVSHVIYKAFIIINIIKAVTCAIDRISTENNVLCFVMFFYNF